VVPIGDNALTSKPLATITRFQTDTAVKSPHVTVYDGKGGLVIVMSTDKHHYLVLPGAGTTIGNIKVENALPEQPHVDPYTGLSEPVVPPVTPVQTLTDVAMITGAGLSSRFEPGPDKTGHSKPGFMVGPKQSVIGRLAGHLQQHGIKQLLVNTFYHPDNLKKGLQAEADKGLTMHYIDEPEPSGSAGAMPKILADPSLMKHLDGKNLVVMMGDSVTNMDISALVNAHKANHAAVTLGCQAVPDDDLDKFGIVVTDQSGKDGVSGKVLKFVEKPGNTPEGKAKVGDSRLCNTGAYVFSPEVMPLFLEAQAALKGKVGSNGGLDFAQNIFPLVMQAIEEGRLQRDGKPLTMQAHAVAGAYWNDIGNMPQYLTTVGHIAKGLLGDKPDLTNFYDKGQVFWGDNTMAHSKTVDKAELHGPVLVAPKAGC
jgi:NDP-sugar pyrophosphorylase family protein